MKMTVNPKEKFVGLFILFSILLSLTVIYVNVRSTLKEKFTYRLVLNQTYGLIKGDKVKLRGLAIGAIESINIIRDKKTNDENIEVFLSILDKKFIEHIRRDSTVTVQPALGPLPGSIEVNPGGKTELLPNNSDIVLLELPKASVEGLIGDISDSIKVFKDVSMKIKTEGLTSMLGPELHDSLKSLTLTAEEIIAQLKTSTNNFSTIVDDLHQGKTTIAKLMFGEIPMLQAILGELSQNRIDELNTQNKGMLEWFFGPTVWGEIEAASQSWQPVQTAILDLITEGKIVMQRSQDILDETMPVIEILTENRENINDMLSTLNQMLDDVKEITAEIADQKEEIPSTVRQLKELMNKSDKLMDSIQRHWLINAFAESKPAKAQVPIKTFRPNHYGE